MAYADPQDPRAREARRNHYRTNRDVYYAKVKEKKLQIRKEIQEAKDKPCADCGQCYPYYVMDFDHRDPSAKSFGVSRMQSMGSLRLVREEIAKCDVVCANCHRIRTHQRRGEAEVAGEPPKLLPSGFDTYHPC